MAECRRMHVESNGNMRGIFIRNNFEQQFYKPKNTIGRFAVLGGENGSRVKRAVE